MNSLSRLASRSRNEGQAAPDPVEAGKIAVMSDGIAAASVSLGRAQRVQTIALSQSSVAKRWQEVEVARRGRAVLAVSAAGFGGLALGLLTLVPRLVPYQYQLFVTLGSLAGMAAPLARTVLALRRTDGQPTAKLDETATRCRTLAALSQKLVKTIERLRGPQGLDPSHAASLDLVLNDLEGEVDGIGASLREQGGAGQYLRRDARIVPRHRKVVIGAPDGRRLNGTIADLSVSGVALTESLPYLSIGHEVTIGSRPAKVARMWKDGIAFTFRTPLDFALFSEDTVL